MEYYVGIKMNELELHVLINMDKSQKCNIE